MYSKKFMTAVISNEEMRQMVEDVRRTVVVFQFIEQLKREYDVE